MKRGVHKLFGNDEDDLEDSPDDKTCTKQYRPEASLMSDPLGIALCELKCGKINAWQSIEQQYSHGQGIYWSLENLKLAFKARLSGFKHAWNYIRRQFMRSDAEEYFGVLDLYSEQYVHFTWERRFTLQFNQLAIISSAQQQQRPINDGAEIETLETLIEEGLEKLHQKLR
ncbi:MAG: hypothetical protein JSR17_06910 [Proteobacteria bacterium]|nr:hypothetical protein [Pseudomonadota bacterium]